jgi:hypothetical protein
MGFFGLVKSHKEKVQRKSEAHDLTNGLQNQTAEPDETFEERNKKRLKRISKFVIIMLFYSYIFTIYFVAFLKITPLFNSTNRFWNFFVGDMGIIILISLITSCLAVGYIFYKLKGLVLAFFNCILAPLAAFFLTLFMLSEIEEWIQRKRFERLSPEEQESILEEQLYLDYKYSSRGP